MPTRFCITSCKSRWTAYGLSVSWLENGVSNAFSACSICELSMEGEKELLTPFSSHDTESPYAVHRDLQEVMQNLVGIFRTDEDLKKALAQLEKLKVRAAKASVEGSRLFNPGWHLYHDLKSMLVVSEAVTLSAPARTEACCAHSRIDYPNLDSD